jgi:hypothetical protein
MTLAKHWADGCNTMRRLRKSKAVSEIRLEEFLVKATTMLRNGEEFGC